MGSRSRFPKRSVTINLVPPDKNEVSEKDSLGLDDEECNNSKRLIMQSMK
jgi:hypothetical protein